MVQRKYIFAIAMVVAATLAGCSATPPATPGPLTAPWSGAVSDPGGLASSSGMFGSRLLWDGDVPIGRIEPGVYTNTNLISISAFTSYRYESEPLGVPGLGGIHGQRQRWVTQTSVSVP